MKILCKLQEEGHCEILRNCCSARRRCRLVDLLENSEVVLKSHICQSPPIHLPQMENSDVASCFSPAFLISCNSLSLKESNGEPGWQGFLPWYRKESMEAEE